MFEFKENKWFSHIDQIPLVRLKNLEPKTSEESLIFLNRSQNVLES